ncbi:S1 RNA-binding domain-containing protein, partial [Phenylobacterium sp.]|uniref:S1 RNA-binding domain-containing protein n=1 Tax=Phenylobacterium sp. TaxID=1871053 RepID=UPI002730859B
MADDMSLSPSRDDFAALLDESLGGRDFMEGTVVKGQVVGVEKDFAIIDVGLKTEGRVLMKEFTQDDGTLTLKVGDTVEVFLERVENAMGEAVISRDKARREEAWTRLEGVYALNEPVMGAIVGRVKGGFTVDLGGASAFLPGSQVDIRPVRDVGPLMGK